MKTVRSSKVDRAQTPEQLVLAAYLISTKDRAFRAFVRRMLSAK
jgi:hypothetical protein